MGRKSILLDIPGGGKGGRQRAWDAMRRRGNTPWTRPDICSEAKLDPSTFESYIQGLLKAGFVTQVGIANSTPKHRGACAGLPRYTITRDVGAEAPRVRRDGTPVTQGLAQEAMWRTLRMLKHDITPRELAAHATTPRIPVSPLAAYDYCKTLAQAGYLDVTDSRRDPHTPRRVAQARYRLKPARDTGPKPPMVCRTAVVFDPNENRIVWMPAVTEEDALYGR